MEIVGEALLRVRHSLIASGPVELEEIETVLTHPQVPGQCSRFLRTELPRARILPASSTAEAVRTWRPSRRPRAGRPRDVLAARIYGGTVLREGVAGPGRQRDPVRLAGAGRRERPEPPLERRRLAGGGPRCCSGAAAPSTPGWLVRCLQEFAVRDINLTKIESRPRQEELGNYVFFADLAARERRGQGRVRRSPGWGRSAKQVRVLGSYRAAPRPRWERWRRRREPPLDSGRENGEHSPTRAGGVRVVLQSTSGTDLPHRPPRRWVVGCSSSTRPSSRSTSAPCAGRWCCC